MRSLCSRCKTEAGDIQQTLCARCGARLTVELEQGDKVGNFEIIAKLPEGDGGMATVFKAKMARRKGYVALKMAHDRAYEYSALQTEAKVLSELHHPNIVEIIPLALTEDKLPVYVEKKHIGGEPKCYIALEYIAGYSLRRLLKHMGKLEPPVALEIVRQIGAALSYAHSKGIVHLDIKPSNILLSNDGPRAVLSDFGIVRPYHTGRPDKRGKTIGTAGYMSPEHIARGSVDHRSDIFSLGVVLYEMLTGKAAFKESTTSQTVAAVIHRDPAAPSRINPAISPDLEQVVLKALTKEKRERFQTTKEFITALEDAIRQPGPGQRIKARFTGLTNILMLFVAKSFKAISKSQLWQSVRVNSRLPNHTIAKLDVGQLTHPGRKRDHNEDSLGFFQPEDPEQLAERGAIYIVADGMGAHEAGAVASDRAWRKVIDEYYYGDSSLGIKESLTRAIKIANEEIYGLASRNPTWAGMGSTIVAAILRREKELYVANVGDSRAYLVRRDEIRRITRDHSWMQQQVDRGELTPEQARRHPRRSVITRCLGRRPDVEVDVFEAEFQPDDKLILCSDGLSDVVRDEEIKMIVSSYSPQEAVQKMIDLANHRGGPDNITTIALSYPAGIAGLTGVWRWIIGWSILAVVVLAAIVVLHILTRK